MTRAEQEIADCLERAYASRLEVDDAMRERLGDRIARKWPADTDAGVAQRKEQWPSKPPVAGSKPAPGTNRSSSTVGRAARLDRFETDGHDRVDTPDVLSANRSAAGSNPACSTHYAPSSTHSGPSSTHYVPPPPATVGKRRGVRRDYLAIVCYAVSAFVATVLVIGAVR